MATLVPKSLANIVKFEFSVATERTELYSLGSDEWVFLDQHYGDAGFDVCIYSNLKERKVYVIGVYDGEDLHVGNLIIDLRVPAPCVADEINSPEFGTSLPPVGILRVPPDMPGGMFTVDKKYVFFISRSAEMSSISVVVPLTTMHFFNTMFGWNFYTKSYLQSGRTHPFSAKRPIPLAIATRSMWIDGFRKWYKRGLGDPQKISFVPDTMVTDYCQMRWSALVIVVGRSEFWLREARASLDIHIKEGKRVLFLSGETMYVEALSSDCGDRYDVRRPDRHWGEKQSNYPLVRSIGPNPFFGGFFKVNQGEVDPGHGNFHIVTDAPVILASGLRKGDTIHLPSTAYDGLPLDGFLDDGTPIISRDAVSCFHDFVLLGWSGGKDTPKKTIGAFCAFRTGPRAGICVHTGSMAWANIIGSSPPTPQSLVAEKLVGNLVSTLVEGRGASFFEAAPILTAEEEAAPDLTPEKLEPSGSDPDPPGEPPTPLHGENAESQSSSTAGVESQAITSVSPPNEPAEDRPLTTPQHQCNICGSPVTEFKQHLGKPRSCPKCNSSERVRTFAAAYSSGALGVDLQNKNVLLVSPSGSELRFLRAIDGIQLTTLDIRPDVKPDIVADLCSMPGVPDCQFDYVYASCVLNCVYDLHAALSEIHRVLKVGGCFLNVEMLSANRETIERKDSTTITAYYGKEEFEKYRVGGYRSFGDLDYPHILGRHFAHVHRVWVLDLPYDKGQWWHVASRQASSSGGQSSVKRYLSGLLRLGSSASSR